MPSSKNVKMFNQQQQQFQQQQFQQQQFQQHLRKLQQHILQQRPPPPAPPFPPPHPSASHPIAYRHPHQGIRPVCAPAQTPSPHMGRLCSASQASIMAANPMLQGALLMHQMQASLQGFAMGGQQFSELFSAGLRPSLLGPAPMGVDIKSPYMGFPQRQFHPHAQHYNKDIASQQSERKKENELRAVGTTSDQSAAKKPGGENNWAVSTEGAVAADRLTVTSAELHEGPSLKRPRTEGSESLSKEPPESNGALRLDHKTPAEEKEPTDAVTLEEGESMAGPETVEFIEECRAPEMVGVGATLKVTIQQSSESRAFNTGLEEQSGGGAGQGEDRDLDGDAASKFVCYICSTTCHNQQNFQSHMNGLAHQQRMMEIQHMSNACLVTLLPRVRESLERAHRAEGKRLGPQRWCATCQTHFYGDLIQHRRTKEHKMSKHSSRPFCTVCKCHFRTPRKFVEHMKSPEHKQRVEELRQEGLPEVLEELITVDAVGCFEGEEDYEEEPNEQEGELDEEQGFSQSQGGHASRKEVALEDMMDNEVYDPDTQYGSSFVVPVAGFLCRLCRKFYHFESTARLSHCQSLAHFQNLQKYRALRRKENAGELDTCSDNVEETPAVTEEGEEDGQETENHALPDPSGFPPEPASPCAPDDPRKARGSCSSITKPDGAALPSDLSVTVSQPTATGSVGCQLAPWDHTSEVVDLTIEDTTASSISCPQQRDSLGDESGRQTIPVHLETLEGQEPPREDTSEQEEQDEDVPARKEVKAKTGRKRMASRKR